MSCPYVFETSYPDVACWLDRPSCPFVIDTRNGGNDG